MAVFLLLARESAKGKMVYVEQKEHVSQSLEGWEDFIMG